MTARLGLFLRGFLLQALFNARWKQRGGLVWSLRDRCSGAEREPFNVNPVLAGYATGWMWTEGVPAFARDRAALSAALGAIGDRLVWGLLRPLAIAASLTAAAAGPIAAGVTMLVVYNPAELCLRWRSLRRGLDGRSAVLRDLTREGLLAYTPRLARMFALCVGILAGSWLCGAIVAGRYADAAAGSVATVAVWAVLRRRTFGPWVMPVAALLLGLAWFGLGWIRAGLLAARG